MDPIEDLKINLKVAGHELTAEMNWSCTMDENGKIVAIGWDLDQLLERNVEIPRFGRTDTEISDGEKVLYGGTLRALARFFFFPPSEIGRLDVEEFRALVDTRLKKKGAEARD